MKLKFFQVDAFSQHVFGGNPAGVCVLESWLPDKLMQQIAMENNLAETAFMVKSEDGYVIRWFTPLAEVALCGHATLAAAHVLYQHYNEATPNIVFNTLQSGKLVVSRGEGRLQLDFPKDQIKPVELTASLKKAIGMAPFACYKGLTDYLLLFDSEADVKNMQPDFSLLRQVDARGVIVSARGNEVDFVSRFFAPQVGIDEDPVTGSAHTSLIPVWSKILGKDVLIAEQISPRKGRLFCVDKGDRVLMGGYAITYLEGHIHV